MMMMNFNYCSWNERAIFNSYIGRQEDTYLEKKKAGRGKRIEQDKRKKGRKK